MITWNNLSQKHAGETCLIVGNGPSLNKISLELLEGMPSFGTNRIYLHEKFQPTYYAAVNPLVQQQFLEEALRCLDRTEVFFISPDYAKNHTDERILPINSLTIPPFSRVPSRGVNEGWTVTYVCMQLALWMGFSQWLLVGVDHSYKVPEGVGPNQELRMRERDPNHFTPEYFRDANWHSPDLERSERSYKMAKEIADSEGIRVLNLTPGSKLDVFERGDCDQWRTYLL